MHSPLWDHNLTSTGTFGTRCRCWQTGVFDPNLIRRFYDVFGYKIIVRNAVVTIRQRATGMRYVLVMTIIKITNTNITNANCRFLLYNLICFNRFLYGIYTLCMHRFNRISDESRVIALYSNMPDSTSLPVYDGCSTFLTHFDRDEMAAILQRIFQIVFF